MWLANRLFPSVRRLQARLAVLEAPVPPPHLIDRVNCNPTSESFLAIGRHIYWDIHKALTTVGLERDTFKYVLDLGCGPGRIIRYFMPKADRRIVGADIDLEAITWCRQNLACLATFDHTQPLPPLPYADGTFDFVYCISVFTHLSEPMAEVWHREIHRVLRPGGIVLASFMANAALTVDNGFFYTAEFPTHGLPSFYGIAHHTRERVEHDWGRHFSLLGYQEALINNRQDSVVCIKR